MRVALPLALALWAGCRFDGGFGTGLLCPTGECPAGQVCTDGVCGLASPDDAGVIDAGESADGSAPDAADEANLVDNPGMEDGIEGWFSYNSTHTVDGDPHGGTSAMLVCADADPDFSLYQDIIDPPEPVPQGQAYQAAVWVRAEPDAPAPGSVKLTIRERGGATDLLDHDGTPIALVGTDWMQLQAEGMIQEADRTTLILVVWGLAASAGDCFAVDDAAMRPE